MIQILASFLIGFAFGTIPFSYIIARIKGIDLKKEGSGNIGATNLGRSLGPVFFLVGFFLDGLKGFGAVLLAKYLQFSPALTGAGAILGHIFNPFFRFCGGKGVATTIGVAIGIIPRSFLIALLVWLIVYFASYIVSLSSISFAIALPISAIILKEAQALQKMLTVVICLLVIYGHRANIKRLLNRQEPKTILWRRD